jgi:hypothetical protein
MPKLHGTVFQSVKTKPRGQPPLNKHMGRKHSFRADVDVDQLLDAEKAKGVREVHTINAALRKGLNPA